MRNHASYLIGSFALIGALTACGDDSGGGGAGGSDTTATTSATGTTGSTNPSTTSGSTNPTTTNGAGGEVPSSGGSGPGSGGDDTGSGAGGDGSGGDDTGSGAGGDGSGGDDAGTGGSGGASCDGIELTVHNYVSWCTVTVGDEAPTEAATQVVCVPEGVTDLTAEGFGQFVLGDDMWHHTDGDEGQGEAGDVEGDVSSAVITVSAENNCVWVCCPFPNGTGCDPEDIGDLCE